MDCHFETKTTQHLSQELNVMREMQEQIDEIMDNFDFERVHKMMQAVDWKWSGDDGFSVPNISELRKTARQLLYRTIDDSLSGCGTGGFNVLKGKDYILLHWGPEYVADIEEEANLEMM